MTHHPRFFRPLLGAMVLALAALAPAASASAQTGPGNYSYVGFMAYGSGGGTELAPYPIGVGAGSLSATINSAEMKCAIAGYQACNLTAHYLSSGTCAGETVTAPCYTVDLSGYSKEQSKPSPKEREGTDQNYTVSYAITDIVVSLSAAPAAIDAGGSSTLSWTVSNEDPSGGTKCSIDNGVGSVSAEGGSKSVSPAQTTTYTLTCTDGASDDPDKATDQATVTVNGAGGAGPDLTAGAAATAPAAPQVGAAAQLSGLVHNTGDASTGGAFSDLFELYQGAAPPERFSDLTATRAAGPNAALGAGKQVEDDASYTFPAAGTWWVRLCANTDAAGNTPGAGYAGTAESSYDDNCSAGWTQLSVGETLTAPDLTASAAVVTPAAPFAGEPASLAGTVANQGADASAASPDLFELYQGAAPPARFSDLTATRVFKESAPLASGAQSDDAAGYTFPAAGTWWVRLCANTDAAGNTPPASGGVQDEASYDNNCSSAWTSLTVFTAPTPSVSCIGSGTGLTVDWLATATGFAGAPTYAWTDTAGNTGSGNPWEVTYTSRNDYGGQVTATYQDQQATSPECFTDITCKAGGTPVISANPDRVPQGGVTTLSWGVSSVANSCEVTGTDGFDSGPLYGNPLTCGLDKTGGTDTVYQQTKYCIVCDGGAPVCVVVNVVPGYQEF
jgi:hypothetical protein